MKIYLSPSAQPHNAYAVGNTTEQVQCNRIATAAKKALERNGYVVKKAPEGQSYVKNVAESNAWGADIHMPIHTNAGGNKKGTLGLCYRGCVNNKYMQAVYKAVAECTPWSDLGIGVKNDLYEINQTKMMCVYIECAFHDKVDSAQWIIDNVEKLGEAIAKGFCAADGKKYISAGGTKTVPKQVPGNPINNFGLQYRAHCQTAGWLDWVHDGQIAGITNPEKRLEAIQINSLLKIKAKAHIQGIGTVDYGYITKDTVIGSTNEKRRLEALMLEAEGLPNGRKLYVQMYFAGKGWGSKCATYGGSFGMGQGTNALKIWVE